MAIEQIDSTVLTYRDFIDNIRLFHPLAKKANLEIELGEAHLLMAKGMIDPMIKSEWDQKNFDDDLYYRRYKTTLNFSTPLGIGVTTGYENTDGVQLNPENKTSNFGLWNIGIEVDLLQGLFINERRTALQQAKVFQELSQNEREIQLRNLFYDATNVYLLWQFNYSFQKVLEENIEIGRTGYVNTKDAYLSGEQTAMDTLEAFILYQDAIANLRANEANLIKSRQRLENFLWFNDEPIALQEDSKPEDYQNKLFGSLLEFSDADLNSHPEILSSLNKLSYLELAQKLKREKLKPKLKVKYNPLLATSENSVAPSNIAVNDFKWGFDFSFPLLLRGARGEIKQGSIKLEQERLILQAKQNDLQNKIENSWLQYNLFIEQIALLNQNVDNYKRLLDGENIKFRAGESSVFMLNKRQEKYIESQLKLISNYFKLQIEELNFLYFSNQVVN